MLGKRTCFNSALCFLLVETFWNIERHPDFSEVVCEVGGQKILLGDLKTLELTMSSREQKVMKTFSSKFIGVGWLNDKIRFSVASHSK